MKRNYTDVDYGFECEFFAVNEQDKKVYNASYLISEFFDIYKGYDRSLIRKASAKLHNYYLSPNNLICYDSWNYQISNPVLLSNPYHNLIADGTAFEVVCKESYKYKDWYPYKDQGVFKKDISIGNQYNKDIDFYRSYVEKTFNLSTLLTPYLSEEDGWEFVNPGWVFSGLKTTINARTGKGWVDDKKWGDKKVTFRTAGFHIHIRFLNKEDEGKMFKDYSVEEGKSLNSYEVVSPPLCNELIQELDSAYYLYISYLSEEDKERELLRAKKYATLGNYRIKIHHGFRTLEYRQFSSVFLKLTLEQQQNVMAKFNEIVIEFLNKI